MKKSPKLTPTYLEKLAWQAREDVIGAADAEEGDCQPVAERLEELLERDGHDPGPMYGTFMGHPHQWIVVGKYSIDPTRDQFRHYAETEEEEEKLADSPVVVWK